MALGARVDSALALVIVHTCVLLQPEQVAEELATGVSGTPEWKALAAHRADIEKT